ncbi:MAG: OB-fold domain-containing protein [Alphaproteobacteria bacterium]
MIAHLKGLVFEIGTDAVIVDVHGVGYLLLPGLDFRPPPRPATPSPCTSRPSPRRRA